MADRGDKDTRELRLEGLGLIVTGGVLIALLAGTFYLGRWVERQAHPSSPVAGSADAGPLAGMDADQDPLPVEVGSGSDVFDGLAGETAEPGRQAVAESIGDEESSPAPGQAPAAAGGPAEADDGDFFVQVFAGRDRASAETLVDELRRGGYGVKIVSEREAGGAVFKVRVGGYATRDDAVDAAQTLKQAGYPTWVTSEG